MKRIILILFLAANLPTAYADEYTKPNGDLSLFIKSSAAKFSIETFNPNGSYACKLEGIADSIGESLEQRHRWIYSEPSGTCVVVLSKNKDGSVIVRSRDCENSCDIHNSPSIDGKYMNK